MKKHFTFDNIFAYLIITLAVLITAYKGNLDYMGLAIIAVIVKFPGTQWIRNMFKRKEK